jgi:predicted DNA-binding transcriptional regulator YafY
MHFAPESALIALDNRAYWDTLEEQPDGSIIVTFATPDLQWAASIVLSYGSLAVVLEPEELRHLVREWAGVIAAQYASPQSKNEDSSCKIGSSD